MKKKDPMSNRYADYTKLKIDFPTERILRLTFNRPETRNSVDAETHTQLTDSPVDADTNGGRTRIEPASLPYPSCPHILRPLALGLGILRRCPIRVVSHN
jgi:hypothetical protein